MCVAYNRDNQLIYTGGHDGSLIAWNFETGYIKYYLHEFDPTCMSKSGDYIRESKSVDCVRITSFLNSFLAAHSLQEEIDRFSDRRSDDTILGLRCDQHSAASVHSVWRTREDRCPVGYRRNGRQRLFNHWRYRRKHEAMGLQPIQVQGRPRSRRQCGEVVHSSSPQSDQLLAGSARYKRRDRKGDALHSKLLERSQHSLNSLRRWPPHWLVRLGLNVEHLRLKRLRGIETEVHSLLGQEGKPSVKYNVPSLGKRSDTSAAKGLDSAQAPKAARNRALAKARSAIRRPLAAPSQRRSRRTTS